MRPVFTRGEAGSSFEELAEDGLRGEVKGVTIIEASAFAGCSALETVNTPQPLSQIGDYAFDGCQSLKAFSLDASISALGKGCFRGCGSLEKVVFPTSFTEIPDEAFYGCASLEEIRCPATGWNRFGNYLGQY